MAARALQTTFPVVSVTPPRKSFGIIVPPIKRRASRRLYFLTNVEYISDAGRVAVAAILYGSRVPLGIAIAIRTLRDRDFLYEKKVRRKRFSDDQSFLDF